MAKKKNKKSLTRYFVALIIIFVLISCTFAFHKLKGADIFARAGNLLASVSAYSTTTPPVLLSNYSLTSVKPGGYAKIRGLNLSTNISIVGATYPVLNPALSDSNQRLDFKIDSREIPGSYKAVVTNSYGKSNSIPFTILSSTGTSPVPCSKDLFSCPDGQLIGRSGPSCTFACPTVSTTTPSIPTLVASASVLQTTPGGWAKLRGKNLSLNVALVGATYPVLSPALSDSSQRLDFKIDPREKPGTYQISVTNPYGTSNSLPFTILCKDQSPIWDSKAGVCMEKDVSIFFNDNFWIKAKTCDDCPDYLPQPIISVNKGTQPAPIEVYLNDKKLLNWGAPYLNDSYVVISNPNNVYGSYNIVGGTNSIVYLIKETGKYFQNRYEVLTPNQTTVIKYNIVKKMGKFGSAYFFITNNSSIDMNKAVNMFDSIAQKESALAGLSSPDPYYVIAWPPLFGMLEGGEGDFYFGHHIVSVNYGGEQYYDQFPTVLTQEIGHEYVHNLQDTKRFSGPSFLTEGMADAVDVFSGFRTWQDVGFGGQINQGCNNNNNPDESHYLGRCLFKHLDQDGYLTTGFLQKLFSTNPVLDYRGLSYCTHKFTETSCVPDLIKFLNFLTGKDMTTFVQEELQATS